MKKVLLEIIEDYSKMIEDNWRWFEILDADRDWSSWIEINRWWFEMNDIDDKPKINGLKKNCLSFFLI